MARLYLDNDVVSEIANRTDRLDIVRAILWRHTVLVSAVNLLEACKYENAPKRLLLIDTYRRLSDGCPPAADPVNILLRDVRRVARSGRDSLNITIGEDTFLSRLLQNPRLARDSVITEAVDAASAMQNRFQGVRDSLRDELRRKGYTTFVDDRGKPMGRLRFLQTLFERRTLAADAVGIILNITKTRLSNQRLQAAVNALMGRELIVLNSTGDLWRYFWSGQAVSLLNQGVRMQGYSKRRNPGNADVEQTAYLAFVDIFVTNDRYFTHRVLRIVERVGTKRKRIWNLNRLLEDVL